MALEKPQGQTDDLSIKAQNFGGLNTTASLLNLPSEDSPAMLNVDVDVSGNITKRQGTELVLSLSGTGMYVHPVRSVLGYDFLLMKRGTSLQLVSNDNRNSGAVKTFLGVFNNAASTERPSFCLLSDIEPRVLILHPSAPPVHVKFVEQTMKLLAQPTGTTTITVPNAQRFEFENPVVYVNRAYVGGLFAYNSGTKVLTITGTTPFSGDVTIDLIAPIWQWWAESLRWFGDRFYDVVSRFNVNKADQSVLLPEKMRSDMDNVGGVYGKYPLYAYKTAVWNDTYTFADQPDTVDKYAWTDGSIYNYSATNFPNKAPYFATFSDARTPYPQPPEGVSFLRQRELRFRNDTGIATNNLIVKVDGVQQLWTTNNVQTVTGTNPYFLYKADGTFEGVNGNIARYIMFATGKPIGVSPTAVVSLTNASPTFGGSSHLTTDNDYQSGSYFRVFGLGLWADYLNGYFPSIATVYQGRLVLSGFKNDPTRVVFSATSDSVEPGVKYNFFQVTDDLNDLTTNPFDVVTTSSEADDYVTGLVEWQSSLFVLTRRATFRVSGGDQPISPSRRFVNFVSALGLVNSYCVCRTDSAVFYLSDSGVFNLVPRVADGEYEPIEKSLKIRKAFNGAAGSYSKAAWMNFDSAKKVLYVGLPRGTETTFASGIYVYNTFRDSWTQYDTPGNFKTYMGTSYVDTTLGDGFLLCVEITKSSAAGLVRLYGTRYLDYATMGILTGTTLAAAVGTTYTWIPPYTTNAVVVNDAFWDFTATNLVQTYTLPLTFQVLPYLNVCDLTVYKNLVKLQFGVDWVKTQKGIYLLRNPGTARITVLPRSPVNDSYIGQVTYGTTDKTPLNVFVNKVQNLTYTSDLFDVTTITLTTAQTAAVVEVGNAYLSYYLTPLFVQAYLGTLKKVKHAYLYFDNEPVQDTYTVANLASGQPSDTIVGGYKTDANANISITYDNGNDAESSNDIYGFSELVWDDASFDEVPSAQQTDRYSLFKERLLGVGYGYQMGVWSFDSCTFKLCAYQLDAVAKGKRYTNRRS